jgi:transcriptional regulator with XRE-family HTH domain
MSNIVSGRQIRAARMLAGLTQADLARAAGCHPRSVRYWENKGSNPPTNVASTLDSIEQALNRHGVRFRYRHQESDALIELNSIAICR